MAKNRRATRADVINVFISIDVKNLRAFGFVDEERLPANSAKRAHGRIDAAGNVVERFGKKLFRLRMCHWIRFAFSKHAVTKPSACANQSFVL